MPRAESAHVWRGTHRLLEERLCGGLHLFEAIRCERRLVSARTWVLVLGWAAVVSGVLQQARLPPFGAAGHRGTHE